MAAIYAVANFKGGVGKTTLAMNLAAGLSRRGECAVVDADQQGSAALWAGTVSPSKFPVVVTPATEDLESVLSRLAERHEFVVIDCPPATDAAQTQAALQVAHALLIPVLPSPMDLWAVTRIETMVERARAGNAKLKARLVVNQIETRNAMSRALGNALGEFAIPALRSGISRRAIYRTAALEGASIYHLGARGNKAVKEMEFLIEELLHL